MKMCCLAGMLMSILLTVPILAARNVIELWLDHRVPPSFLFGPVDAAGAVDGTLWSLVQGGTVLAAGAVLAQWASRRPRMAGVGVLLIVTADLA